MPELGYHNPKLSAKVSPTSQDIAWAAGIFEGEGSLTKENYTIHVDQMGDPWLTDRFKVLFGGSTLRYKAHSYPKNWQNRWNASGGRARGILMTFYKFLSPRRKKQVRDFLGV